jgi:hypothetical protein
MASKRHMIEVDETTGTLLRERAAARGVSVAKLVAGMTALAETLSGFPPTSLLTWTASGRRFSPAKRKPFPTIRSHAGWKPGARRTSSRFR